jgi:hypothetical protein
MEIVSIVSNYDDFISEARHWYNSTDKTEQMESAFENSTEGKDLKAIGVRIKHRLVGALVLERKGGPMANVEIWKDSDTNDYCYEYLSTKEGVERYNLSKHNTAERCLRALFLRIIRNNIPAAIIPKKDIPSLDFDTITPIGAKYDMTTILSRVKPIIGGYELSDLDAPTVERLGIIKALVEMGMVGNGENTAEGSIIKKVDIISPKYKFYSRAAARVGEIYSDIIMEVLDVSRSQIGGTLFAADKDRTEVWRVNNTNRIPLNGINFRTGDNSVRCNIQDNEIFGSIFVNIFKRTFRRSKNHKYPKETLIKPIGERNDKLIWEMNDLCSEYFGDAAEKMEPSVFIDVEHKKSQIEENANALLLKYLVANGSAEMKEAISSKPDLQELVDMTTQYADLDAITRKLIALSRKIKMVS